MIDAGYVLFVVLAVAVGAWMNSAQDAYMRAHARANGMEPQTTITVTSADGQYVVVDSQTASRIVTFLIWK